MFPEDKIIEIFSICDDFSKVFDKTVDQNAITACDSSKKRKYHRDGMMSDSEVMTILILFHDSGYRCLKHFYLQYVCKYMRHLFPKTVSYNRFAELERRAVGDAEVNYSHSLSGCRPQTKVASASLPKGKCSSFKCCVTNSSQSSMHVAWPFASK